jgi:hypothetical protein
MNAPGGQWDDHFMNVQYWNPISSDGKDAKGAVNLRSDLMKKLITFD